MNSRRTGTWISRVRRPALAAAAAVAVLAVSGCVYLRLLELKNQLADFDRFFEVDRRDGLKFSFLHPVLLDKDLAFFNLVPERREKTGVAEKWHFRWIKDYTGGGEKPEDFEVTADVIFVEHKLARVHLPERLFAFTPKDEFLSMVKSFGRAQIDEKKRTAIAKVEHRGGPAHPPLAQNELGAMLGAPMEKRETAAGPQWEYRYRGATTHQHSGHINFIFTFD
ncbi:MAG: hypothetical protein A3G75_00225, partial [Verrucomicrobia bacterium RIFCSPLOWO2_12_FULL_64_8]